MIERRRNMNGRRKLGSGRGGGGDNLYMTSYYKLREAEPENK